MDGSDGSWSSIKEDEQPSVYLDSECALVCPYETQQSAGKCFLQASLQRLPLRPFAFLLQTFLEDPECNAYVNAALADKNPQSNNASETNRGSSASSSSATSSIILGNTKGGKKSTKTCCPVHRSFKQRPEKPPTGTSDFGYNYCRREFDVEKVFPPMPVGPFASLVHSPSEDLPSSRFPIASTWQVWPFSQSGAARNYRNCCVVKDKIDVPNLCKNPRHRFFNIYRSS